MPDHGQDERDAAPELEAAFAGLRERRGLCPGAELLRELASGQLAPDDAAAVREHVALCGRCEWALHGLAAVPEPVRWGWAWRFGRFWRAPWPAYALAVVLAWPAYRGLTRPRVETVRVPERASLPVEQRPPGIGTPPVLAFEESRGRAGRAELVLRAEDRLFVLSFFVPVRRGAGWRYEAGLQGPDGRVVASEAELRSMDGLGNFLLVGSAEGLGSGPHTLRVRQVERGSGEAREVGVMRFVVRR